MTDVPAIVLGRVATALGVIRALGRQGIPLFWVTDDPDPVVGASRWSRRFPTTIRPPDEPADLAEFLKRVPVDRAVLIPCSDHWSRAAAALEPALSARFPTSMPDALTLARLTDKGQLAAVLRDHDIPHPRSIQLRHEEDLGAVPPEEISNWFLKPTDSQAFQKTFGRKVFRVQSLQDARSRYRAVRKAGLAVILQEYIPGSVPRHFFVDGFVDSHGELRALFARQRIRMYPREFGDSTYVTSVPLTDVAGAVASVRSLFQGVQYRGIFSVEFKHDLRDDQFKLIEVNTRPWAFVQFPAECGVDVVVMAYRDALGQPVSTVQDYRLGRSTTAPEDWIVGRAQVRRGELSVFDFIRSELHATSLHFRWDDPMPYFIPIGQRLLHLLRKLGWPHGRNQSSDNCGKSPRTTADP